MSPKDIEDLKEATRAIKSLRHHQSVSKLKRVDSSNKGARLTEDLKSSPETLSKVTKERRGGNSNNFSIENLIAKDKGGSNSSNAKGETKTDDIDVGAGEDHISMSDSVSVSMSDVSQPIDNYDLNDDEDELSVSGDPCPDPHEDHENDSNHSNHSFSRSTNPPSPNSDSPTTTKPPTTFSSSTQNNNNTTNHHSSSHSVNHSSNNSSNNTSSNVNSPGNFMVGSAANAALLPAYPLYAAAFLSAQSLLYNSPHYFHHSHHPNIPNQNGNAMSSMFHPPSHFGNHPMNNPAAAMLFNAKDLPGL
ncbi:unnamed protein product [Allacma fusca]|uniref:Uncharacterized protein n=1 Tax=Allacma fusca TaxID=39272 RepID=A0A8J2PEQ1_9HEXA|nr:unnamed protein product [Allacma fusca]